jgi:hypothetical protein
MSSYQARNEKNQTNPRERAPSGVVAQWTLS